MRMKVGPAASVKTFYGFKYSFIEINITSLQRSEQPNFNLPKQDSKINIGNDVNLTCIRNELFILIVKIYIKSMCPFVPLSIVFENPFI